MDCYDKRKWHILFHYSVTAAREILSLKVKDILGKHWQICRDEFKLVSDMEMHGSVFRIIVTIRHYAYEALYFKRKILMSWKWKYEILNLNNM